MSKRGRGEICCWCKRELQSTRAQSGRAATRDHVEPKWTGANETKWCCRSCNTLKGGMLLEDWHNFMAENPRWWELPSHEKKGIRSRASLSLAEAVRRANAGRTDRLDVKEMFESLARRL